MTFAETLDQVNQRLDYLVHLPDMTTAEREEYDRLSAWSKAMTGEAQRRIDANARAGRVRRKGNRLTDDDPPPGQVFIGSDRPSARPGVPWMDAATGQPVRVARKGELLYDFAQEFNEERQGLSIGKMIRGIAGGGWKNAELEKHALDETGSSGGQYLVPETLGS